MTFPLNEQEVLHAATDHVSAEVDGQLVMMSVERGRYYGLDEVGRRVWELLQQPIRLGDLLDTLVEEFEVGRDDCAADIMPFLASLAENDLLTMAD